MYYCHGELGLNLKNRIPGRFVNGRFKRNVQLAVVHWPEKKTYQPFGSATVNPQTIFYHSFFIVDMKYALRDPIKWLPSVGCGAFDEEDIQILLRKIRHFGTFSFSEEEWQDILHMLKGGSGHAVLYLTDDRPAFCNIAEFKMLAGRKEILFLSIHAFAAHIRHMPDKYRTVLSANQKAKIRHDKRVSEMFKKYKNKNKVNEHNYDWRDKLFKTVKS